MKQSRYSCIFFDALYISSLGLLPKPDPTRPGSGLKARACKKRRPKPSTTQPKPSKPCLTRPRTSLIWMHRLSEVRPPRSIVPFSSNHYSWLQEARLKDDARSTMTVVVALSCERERLVKWPGASTKPFIFFRRHSCFVQISLLSRYVATWIILRAHKS